jgi:hypothetical protein
VRPVAKEMERFQEMHARANCILRADLSPSCALTGMLARRGC